MTHYLKLYFRFWQNCLMRDWEFRLNVLVWTFMEFLWFGLFFLSVNLVFGQVDAVAGWTKNEVLLLTCVYTLFHDFLWTFVLDSLRQLSEQIRLGNFDWILLKPVSSRFHVSFRYFESDHYLKIIFLFFLIRHFLTELGINPGINQWLLFGGLFLSGLGIIYNLFFMATTTNFWLTNLFNLQELFDGVVDLGRFPVYIFRGKWQLALIYFLPVAFISTYPTQALMGELDWSTLALGMILVFVTFTLSHLFWRFALKHYSSASS